MPSYTIMVGILPVLQAGIDVIAVVFILLLPLIGIVVIVYLLIDIRRKLKKYNEE